METETQEIPLERELTHLAGKYLTFVINNEECGIEITRVREIIGLMPISFVPKTPDYVKGVINLRGRVIPVIDLRSKFELPETEQTEQTCIIVLEIINRESTFQTGIIVDKVSEVLDISEDQLEPAPYFGNGIETNFILAIAKTENSVKILLDIDKVLYSDELLQLTNSKEQININ